MRYIYLDGIRGLLLISMVMGHLGSGLSLGITHNLVSKGGLLNDAASAFVFLSGLTVALAYSKGWFDPTAASRRKSLRSRTLLVFSHHIFLVVAIATAATIALYFDWRTWILAPYGTAPLLFGAISALMLGAGFYLDILPMYVLFMLLTPLALAAIASGRRWLVIGFVLLDWTMGQTGLLEAMWAMFSSTFGLDHYSIKLGLDFNRLSWSSLYFTGLLLGAAFVRRELDLSVLKQPKYEWLLLVSFFVLGFSMLALSLYVRGILTDHVELFVASVSKSRLGFLTMLNFAAMVFVVTWLLVAGPSSRLASMRSASRQLSRLLSSRILVSLGQHSLLVFSFHVLGVYLFYIFVDTIGIEPWGSNAIVLVGLASLAIPVAIGKALKNRKQRLAQASATATAAANG